jgi:dethiobiotin synthetase
MSAYFVTATGTDIGKTFVTAGLVRHLRESGEPVTAFKPVMSGFDIATAAISDAGVLLDALGDPITPEAIERLSPWRYAAPLSPDMAAARENSAIDFSVLTARCREMIATPGTVFIEGVGGVMVPLDATHTVLDWMVALDIPLIMVTGSYLGTISHTLTSVDVCRSRGLSLAAVVLNQSEHSTVPVEETFGSLSRFLAGVPLVAIPRSKTWIDAREDFGRVWSAINAQKP